MRENKAGVPATEPFVRRHRPFFVALFVLLPVVMMPALLVFTLVKGDSFQIWRSMHVVTDNSYGLRRGNQVSMSGINIGHVKRVDLIREGEIHVTFNIAGRYAHTVRKDSKARLKQKGFVGDWELELTGGSPHSAEAEAGDTLASERAPSIDWFIELAVGVVDTAILLLSNITSIVNGIEAGEGTLGLLVKSDTLYRHINRIGANAGALASDARRLTTDVHLMVQGTQGTLRDIDSLLSTVTTVTKSMGRSGTALVDSLSTMIVQVNKSLGEVDHILKNVKAASNDAPELMIRLQHDLGEAEIMLKAFQESWLFQTIGGGNAPANPHLADTP